MLGKIKKLIPGFLISLYHWLWALLGALFYGFPSSYIKVIGVTGTNGKSTVVSLIKDILEEADFKVASTSSIRFQVGKEEKQNDLKMTMPGRGYLHKFLRKAIKAKCDYAVLEVTSEGIKQHRHRFINFDVAVLTNLEPEHIEAHGSFENYKKAKAELWKQLKKKGVSVINLDDDHSDYFWRFSAGEKYGYGIRSSKKEKVVKAEEIQLKKNSSEFLIDGMKFNLPLPGEFNVSNALAAVTASLSQGVELRTCRDGLSKVEGVPGRMEVVIEKPFKVIVDYAHNLDALNKIYNSLDREELICVLGSCGGGRDKWKRPELGKLADKNCSKIILTNEDPYDEDPERIIDDIKKGIENRAKVEVIVDREKAIQRALEEADVSQVVVITGKGSEPWMCVADGKKVPWDDRKIVKEKIKSIRSNR